MCEGSLDAIVMSALLKTSQFGADGDGVSDASPSPRFIHLRTHSSYSLLEGALRLPFLADYCRQQEMPALALTDRNNLFGALDFSLTMQSSGVQPIIGCTLALRHSFLDKSATSQAPSCFLALLAHTAQGYKNLMSLVSHVHLNKEAMMEPAASMETLQRYQEGIICLSGGVEGPVNALLDSGKKDAASDLMEALHSMFNDRFYIELQRYNPVSSRQKSLETALISMAYEKNIPLVATNQAFFPTQDDAKAHDVLLCVAQSTVLSNPNRRRIADQQYLVSPAQMVALFSDIPEALENTVEIARRCTYFPKISAPKLPRFASSSAEENALLCDKATQGLARRLAQGKIFQGAKAYEDRLSFELQVITDMNFSGYFLIVADFVQWALQQGIPVGPGRGSGAGSVVAWALDITNIDPLRFNLLFERFLNPERISMPDFDIDFCQERRDEVFQYVCEKYGAEQVAHIITFGKLQARAVLRDVGRVLSIPYGRVDSLCKMIPANPANPVSLTQAIKSEPRLQEEQKEDPAVAEMLRIGEKLEGLYRHASTHAAGIVIGDRPLQEIVPLYKDPDSSMHLTQFTMNWVEKSGLVKFDFLGLKTLTMLARAKEFLRREGKEISLSDIPLDCAKTYRLLSEGRSHGVFQLESGPMRRILRQMHPDRFEDIVALVALYRPGPMENIPRFIACKNGEQQPDYLHPLLRSILEETYGVVVYQEQVMQMAQIISGYSLGEADILRRAMGKKQKQEMQAQRKRFVEGALKNGIKVTDAEYLFELVDKFSGYGFNKSHAVAYALVAYQSAYIKAHYPQIFFAASMSLEMDNTDKLQSFCRDATTVFDIPVKVPDVNLSGDTFMPSPEGIIYALCAVKNVGKAVVHTLVKERQENGAFQNMLEFAKRVPLKSLGKGALENLIRAGALDGLHSNRAYLIMALEFFMDYSQKCQEEKNSTQEGLFGGKNVLQATPPGEATPAWDDTRCLMEEYKAVGFYLSRHPLEPYRATLEKNNVIPYRALFGRKNDKELLAGVILRLQVRRSSNGGSFAFVHLSDISASYEVMISGDLFKKMRDRLVVGQCLVVSTEVRFQGHEKKLFALSIRHVDDFLSTLKNGRAPGRTPERTPRDTASFSNSFSSRQKAQAFSSPVPKPSPSTLQDSKFPAAASPCGPFKELHVSLTSVTALHTLKDYLKSFGDTTVHITLQGEASHRTLTLEERYYLDTAIYEDLKKIEGIVAVKVS